MTLRITKDPDRPFGGFALLSAPGIPSFVAEAELYICRLEDDHYLANGLWQVERAPVASYTPRTSPNGVVLRMGPEVSAYVQRYQRLRIEAPALDVSGLTTWPRDVGVAPPEAGSGTIFCQTPVAAPYRSALTPPDLPDETSDEESKKRRGFAPAAPPVSRTESTASNDRPARSRRASLALLAFLIIAGIVSLWAWDQGLFDETLSEPMAEGPAATPSPTQFGEPREQGPEVDADEAVTATGPTASDQEPSLACVFESPDGLTSEDLMKIALACSGEGDLQNQARAVDVAAERGHGAALLQRARWFDPAFEESVPSPYTRNAPNAARDYFAAVKSGVADAEPLLASTCDRLQDGRSGVEKRALDQFC